LQRHGISRLPDVDGGKPAKRQFKRDPIAYMHIDIAEVRTAEDKLYMIVAIVRTSKFDIAEMNENMSTISSSKSRSTQREGRP